jgi:hypothetical protein
MAYVYTTGGHEIYARSETREELTNRIQGDRDAVLELKANGFMAGNAPVDDLVTVPVSQIAAISNRQLPKL